MGIERVKLYREIELDLDTDGLVILTVETELPQRDIRQRHSETINTETTTRGRRPWRVRLSGTLKGVCIRLHLAGSVATRLYGAKVLARPLGSVAPWAWYDVPNIRPTPQGYTAAGFPIRQTPEGYTDAQLPLRQTPIGYSEARLPIDPTPEGFGSSALPIRATSEGFSVGRLPVRETPEAWGAARLPVQPTPEGLSVGPLPVRPTPEAWSGLRLPIRPTPVEPEWVSLPVDE